MVPAVRRRAVLQSGALAVGTLAAATLADAAPAATAPATIPGVRSWRPRAGHFTLPAEVVVVVAPEHEALGETARQLAHDLGALTGRPARAVVRNGVRHGEIHLRRGTGHAHLGAEGYRLDVGPAVLVTARTRTGAYYGGRSLLQMLVQSTGHRVPAGTALDRPQYAERGLMVDIGRKFYPEAWLAARIRELGWLKLNRLHLHISDHEGFRVECKRTPGVHSDRHLSQAAVRRLLALAARHHVTIVPEVDMPGHMTAALRHYPDLQLRDPAGQAEVGCLDYTLPAAREFADGLLQEFAQLFPGPEFHLGADEFLPSAEQARYPQLTTYAVGQYGPRATSKDGLLQFVNANAALVRRHRKRARAWNDGIGDGGVTRLDREVDVEWWTDISPIGDATGIPTPQQVLDAGHRLVNCSFLPTYYVNTSRPVPGRPDLTKFYESWSVPRFHGAAYDNEELASPGFTVARDAEGLLGAKLHLWNDEPGLATPAQDTVGIAPRLRVMAQQAWGSPKPARTYPAFAALDRRLGNPPA